jgi:hypothetical protein
MKKVWSSSLQLMVGFKFLCWLLSHDYNHQMNDNDIADQLQRLYQIMHFQRNNKWGWELFWQGYKVLLMISYVFMKGYCELKGVPVHGRTTTGSRPLDTRIWTLLSIGQEGRGLSGMMTPLVPESRTKHKTSDLKKAPRVDSMSLSTTRGQLKGFLDHDTKTHMPLPPLRLNATCQLHCWAYK